ncbi:MAG: FliI/YscN family ATPase [Bdellovibrionales bacterium]|jgi:flagellum-specific ATP synthase|nr:FliI/YscN family ATPase [Bdellovibrionales bacterium]
MEPTELSLNFSPIRSSYEHSQPFEKIGKVISNHGLVYEVSLSRAIIGASVEFITESGDRSMGEVVSINNKTCMAMPYNDLTGINTETRVILKDITTEIKVSDSFLGRVLDFQCEPFDGKGKTKGPYTKMNIFGQPINPLDRPPIDQPLDTGIHAINCFNTVGKGQRMAIMSGSGVGKSVLLGMIAQNTTADVNVISLVGERGREVLEFIENDLGPEGLKKSVIIVATSDTSPLVRIKSAYVATTIAEYFRNQGKDVLFLMDSITRFAMAMREIGLSSGEPPGQKGYTPSVFAKLPKILERAGTKEGYGSITGLYTVLVEGGDFDEPISDAIRAISDGHIVLSRDLAAKNHFPAIDVLSSISRLMNRVATPEHRVVSGYLKDLMASYKENEDLINVGAYAKGSNNKVDRAILIYEDLMELLKQEQGLCQFFRIEDLFDRMVEIARKAKLMGQEEDEAS